MNVRKPGLCVCTNLRSAARSVTHFYDDLLAPSGLKVTQFALLRTLQRCAPVSITELAEQVRLDRTTLARNLRVLERDELIAIAPGDDRRERSVSLSAGGEQVLREALPYWEQAQRALREALDPDEWRTLMALLAKVAAVVD